MVIWICTSRFIVFLFFSEKEADSLNKVIAMSLYGSNGRYINNALRNVKMLKENFPGWKLWFYTEKKVFNKTLKFPAVIEDTINKLAEGGAEMKYVDIRNLTVPPMMWRFLIVDDTTVDVFIIRDCDSHLTKRDSIVVNDWLKINTTFHCVRDHPSHARSPISGGMWGARREPFAKLLGSESMASLMAGYGAGYHMDMNFLNKVIWPKVQGFAYCHDSVSCKKYPGGHPFPVVRQGYEHIGQVFNGKGVARASDINVLKKSKVNKDCVPP